MGKSIKNIIRKDVDYLILKSFPILKKKNIVIKLWRNKGKFHPMGMSLVNINGNLLLKLNPCIGKLSKKARLGLLAHELVHLEDYAKRTSLKNLIWIFTNTFNYYIISKIYPKLKIIKGKEHKKVDIKAIENGYGKNLIAYKKFLGKNLNKEQLSEYYLSYLSEKEIKDIMKRR